MQILVAAFVFSALSAATGPKHSRYQLCLDPCRARHLGVPVRLHPPSGGLACAEGCACHDMSTCGPRARCVRPEQCGRSYQVSGGLGFALVMGAGPS